MKRRRRMNWIFAVDTIADRCPDGDDYKTAVAVKTKEGLDLVLKSKNHYDEQSQTQFSPSVYNCTAAAACCKASLWIFKRIFTVLGKWSRYYERSVLQRFQCTLRLTRKRHRTISAKCFYMNAVYNSGLFFCESRECLRKSTEK